VVGRVHEVGRVVVDVGDANNHGNRETCVALKSSVTGLCEMLFRGFFSRMLLTV
jgi:hypothetical protein